MAKRSYGKTSKIQPSVMTLYVNTSTVAPGATGSFTVDLSQIASVVNRRFYRQGLNWAVAGFKVFGAQGALGTVAVKKIPNTWVSSNAWEKAFRHWNRQIKETLDEGGNESARAKFSDFKIYMDQIHRADGYAANLVPLDGQLPVAQPYVMGEWDPSHVVLPQTAADGSGTLIDPTEFTLHMVGSSTGASKGLIQGYEDSRAFPQSPDPVAPAMSSANNWLNAMFDEGSANPNILDNAENENDELPYPQQDYPGGPVQAPALQIHDISGLTATTVGGNTYLKGGNFPCGLIRFDWTVDASASTSYNIAIQIDMVPGSHRGYLAEPMTEM